MRTVFNEIENRHELTDELTDEMRYIVVVAQGTSYPTGTGRPQVLSLIIHQTDFKSEEMGTGTASRHSPTGRMAIPGVLSKVHTNHGVVAASALLAQVIITTLKPCAVADPAADWEEADPLQRPEIWRWASLAATKTR